MANIKSDIANKGFKGPAMRQFEVPDESEAFDPAHSPFDYTPDDAPSGVVPLDLNAINQSLISRGLPALDAAAEKAVAARNAQIYGQAPPPQSNASAFSNVAAARKLKATGKERLGEAAKRRVEMLCGMFSLTRTVELGGQIFILRTLKGKEIKESIMAASVHDGTVAVPFETRKQYLSRSLVQIAGTEVEMFLGDDSTEARLEFVEELPETILGVLFTEYLLLAEESSKKYGINNEATAKEVVADLKK